MRTILQIQVQLHVARLGDEVNLAVLVLIAARAQTSHAPASHAVGTTREVALLERQHLTVAIGIGDAEAQVHHQLIVLSASYLLHDVEVGLHVLGIGYIEHLILSERIAIATTKCASIEVQQVSSRLQMRSQGQFAIVVVIAQTHAHDEEVLVVITQNGVRACGIVEILALERFTHPGHEHIVQVYQVEGVVIMAVLGPPLIVPSGREHSAMELRTILRVVKQRHLTGGSNPAPDVATQEGEDESWERQSALHAVFEVVLILIALQTSDSLVGTTQLNAECFRTLKQIAVLISQRSSSSEVASRIRSLRLETDGRGFVRLNLYVGIEQRGVGHLIETDVGIPHGTQSAESIIRVLQIAGRVEFACPQEGILFEHMLAQMNHGVVGSTTAVGNVSYIVLAVQRVAILLRLEGVQHLRQCHSVLLSILPGAIGHVFLMETEVATILQIRRNLRALRGHRLGIKLHALLQ